MTKKNGFNVGDKVKVIKLTTWKAEIQVGMTGVVKHIHPSGQPRIGVEFDEYIDGHELCVDCNVPKGHGWYMYEDEVEVIKSKSTESEVEKITVILEGKKTTVTLEDGSAGTSNLMHGDTYSVEKGIEIAKAKALIARKTKKRDELRAKASKLSAQISGLQREYQEVTSSIPWIDDQILELEEEIAIIGG